MNIILFDKSEISGQTVSLEGGRAKHIVKVLRAECDDVVKVGIIDGKAGFGVIRNIVKKPPYHVDLEISLKDEVPNESKIDIMLALPRPIMFKRILSQATALGVGAFYVVNGRRVEKSFWDSSLINESSYREHLIKGLEQAVDTRLPSVYFYKGFKPFIEKNILQIKENYKYLLVAHPSCPLSLIDVFTGGQGKVLLAVGPEGGWIDYEIDKMQEAGFQGFGLGKRILKVDTAVIALHSMITILNR